jgi:hypothetical protein
LPLIQFFDRELFPWMDAVEKAAPAIRAEAEAVMRDGAAFTPYVESEPNRPHNDQKGMLGNPDWSAFYLWKRGELVAQNAARCPETMRAMEHVPLVKVQNRSPSVLFSLLRPGAHIPPHNGMVNTRLICHLPLILPGQCALARGQRDARVGRGPRLAFDDTIEHEAWNRSQEPRVVLIFESMAPGAHRARAPARERDVRGDRRPYRREACVGDLAALRPAADRARPVSLATCPELPASGDGPGELVGVGAEHRLEAEAVGDLVGQFEAASHRRALLAGRATGAPAALRASAIMRAPPASRTMVFMPATCGSGPFK